MIFKGCARCGAMVPYGLRYCARCQPGVQAGADEDKRRSMMKYNSRRDPKYARFYNSHAWALMRERVLSECGYLCELCHTELATSVHHVVPLTEDWSRRLDRSNLKGACDECHNREHKRFVPGRRPGRGADRP